MSVLALLHIPSGWMGQSLNPEDAPEGLGRKAEVGRVYLLFPKKDLIGSKS